MVLLSAPWQRQLIRPLCSSVELLIYVGVVVFQSLHFSGNIPAIFCLKHFRTCILFGACIYAVSPSDLSRHLCCGSSVQWNNRAGLDWQSFIKSTTLLNMFWTSLERWHRNHVTKTSDSSKLTVAPKADGFLSCERVLVFSDVLRGAKMVKPYPDHVLSCRSSHWHSL